MGIRRAVRGLRDSSGARHSEAGLPETVPLSDGEIHYLWWFIQGVIMDVSTRWKLRHAWGLCGRHGWGALATEAAFRHGFLHGPAVLYEDIMGRALRALQIRGPLQARRLPWKLRERGPCMMCEMDLGPGSRAAARPKLIESGRDPRYLLAFAAETRAYWWKTVCGRCVSSGSSARCRPHLVEETSTGPAGDPAEHRALVQYNFDHVRAYRRSFVWEHHGTDTAEDRAALISAVGWCSGWHPWVLPVR